ncbi:MAG: hypothetical protein ABEH77_00985, partial [Halobacteriaceae archaeon]
RGGFGSWNVGLTHAGRFAAAAPAASYFRSDAHATRPFARRVVYGEEPMGSVWRRAGQHGLTLPKTENAADGTLPVFALHGGRDEAVSPVQARTVLRALAERGLSVRGAAAERHPDPDPDAVDAAYLEVPGREHWWGGDLADSADAVNHPDLWSFVTDCEREPWPDHLRFVTWNLRVEDTKRWVTVHRQQEVYRRTRVDARATDDGVAIDAENVAVLALDPGVFDALDVPPTVRVGGEAVAVPDGDGPVVVEPSSAAVSRSLPAADGPRKDADQYGPLSEVVLGPYRIVYGTAGSAAATELNRRVACLESRRLVDRARSHGTVIPDTAVDGATHREHNLLLVGRPDTNAVHERLHADLPVAVADGAVTVGDWEAAGDLAVKYLYPNPAASDRLVGVYAGTTERGTRLLRRDPRVPGYRAFDSLPDFHVYDERVRSEGWNGCRAAGFFDRRWRVDDSLAAFR